MLDGFKNRGAGSKHEVIVDERHELERLIQTARAERAAMDETLLSLRARSASLTPIGKSLEHIDREGDWRDDEARGDRRAPRRARRPHPRARTARWAYPGSQGCRQAGGAERPESDAAPMASSTKHREAVEQLSSQARQTHASLDTLRMEHAALEELRGQLRAAQTEIKQSVDHAGALESELEQIRGVASGLTEDCARRGRDLADGARRHHRRDDGNQGSGKEARTTRPAPGAGSEH